jgi:hypothetical protein
MMARIERPASAIYAWDGELAPIKSFAVRHFLDLAVVLGAKRSQIGRMIGATPTARMDVIDVGCLTPTSGDDAGIAIAR